MDVFDTFSILLGAGRAQRGVRCGAQGSCRGAVAVRTEGSAARQARDKAHREGPGACVRPGSGAGPTDLSVGRSDFREPRAVAVTVVVSSRRGTCLCVRFGCGGTVDLSPCTQWEQNVTISFNPPEDPPKLDCH